MRYIFKRNDLNQDGEKVYLWYHTTAKWRLSKGLRFQTKSHRCWMFIDSDGEFLNLKKDKF